ncbi:hypothetical protein [Sphingomonas crusticola]|uniref:hypothetical protein n=1 Tax=Sphingomonas crusticola TaxID=1697973 RepID=UPI000E27F095|nr:hypothetical protein [Sphingomonas crusticola]
MLFVAASILLAFLVTLGSARWLTLHATARSASSQVMLAALSFPLVALALFVVAVCVALISMSRGPDLPGQSEGMPIFAAVFFLIYAWAIGAIVGLPTAIVAVRMFRPG